MENNNGVGGGSHAGGSMVHYGKQFCIKWYGLGKGHDSASYAVYRSVAFEGESTNPLFVGSFLEACAYVTLVDQGFNIYS